MAQRPDRSLGPSLYLFGHKYPKQYDEMYGYGKNQQDDFVDRVVSQVAARHTENIVHLYVEAAERT